MLVWESNCKTVDSQFSSQECEILLLQIILFALGNRSFECITMLLKIHPNPHVHAEFLTDFDCVNYQLLWYLFDICCFWSSFMSNKLKQGLGVHKGYIMIGDSKGKISIFLDFVTQRYFQIIPF